RHAAHPALGDPRPARPARRVRAPRPRAERALHPAGRDGDREGAALPPLDGAGVECRARAVESRARERDEEGAAARLADERSAAGAEGDVAADARRAPRAARAAGPAGRRGGRARGDEPPDAPAPREGAAQRAPAALGRAAVALVVERGPELEQPLALERAELASRLALVDRQLVLDHLAGERLV